MPGDLTAIPVMLWNWGLANLAGRLRTASGCALVKLSSHDAQKFAVFEVLAFSEFLRRKKCWMYVQ